MEINNKKNRKNDILTALMAIGVITLVATIATSAMVSSVSAQYQSVTQRSYCINGKCYTEICISGQTPRCQTYEGTNYKVVCKSVNGVNSCTVTKR